MAKTQAKWSILQGDCRANMRAMPAAHFHTVCTSPPYLGLRDYGIPGIEWPDGSVCCFGLEPTIDLYLAHTVEICREIRRVLRDDGTLWWNIGDSYASDWPCNRQNKIGNESLQNGKREARPSRLGGLKEGDQCLVPHRVAIALQDDGWYLRSTIVWHKRSPMPESVSGWRWVQCRVKVGPSNRANGHKSDAMPHKPHGGYADDGKSFASSAKWKPCPGCPKCSPNGGYVLKQGRWRPTTAHEYIFLFSKTDRYFCDGEAVKELASQPAGVPMLTGQHKIHREVMQRNGRDGSTLGTNQGAETRNPRTVWTLSNEPFKGAHFAVFPSALPKKCIEAATSSAGCCAACGSPYAPVVESERVPTRPGIDSKTSGNRGDDFRMEVGNRDHRRHVAVSRTLGHRPTCACNAATAPCRVLEPFCGSGTTLQVATQLGREAVGIEQNPDYIEIAKKRIVTPLRTPKVKRAAPPPAADDKQGFLFAEGA